MDDADVLTMTRQIAGDSARRAGVPRHAIDDVTGQVLEKYYKKWKAPQAPDDPAAWIQTVADNTVTDYWRDQQRKPRVPFAPSGDDPLSLLMDTLRAAGTPSLTFVEDAVWQDALALVSDSDADVLRRRFMDGIPAADLAVEFGVSPAVIDTRVARAKKRMQTALAKRPDLVWALRSGHQHSYLSDQRLG